MAKLRFINKKILKLKELFDEGSSELINDYWTGELLEIYSETLGERIRWKWDSFLEDLKNKSVHPELLLSQITSEQKPLLVLDWGCGPGTASIAFAESFLDKASLHFRFEDRSVLAKNFTHKRLEKFLNRNPSENSDKIFDSATKLMLISYVLSELDSKGEAKLLAQISQSDVFCWVDSGAFKESRKLSQIRNTLLTHFYFFSPCPHQLSCPLSNSENPKDWCHRFAPAPQEVFHSAKWAEIAKTLKIDLKSLPYASLYGIKKYFVKDFQFKSTPQELGRPRVGKHEAIQDFCTPEGKYEKQSVSKRANPELFKKLRKMF